MSGDSDVQVRFGAQIEGLVAGIESAKASISSITAPINSVVSAFSEMKEVLIAAFAIDQAAEFVDRITEVGEQILRGTQMTGLSAEEFQTLQYAMRVTGGEAGNLGVTIDRLERNIALARGGSGQAVQAFATLGVSMDDLKNKTPYQIIEQIADGFHNLKDPILAAAAATEVGSRGFAQMLPALKAGSEGLKEFGETFKNTGAYLNDTQAGAFAATHESLVQLQTSVEGTGVQLVRLLKPAIDLTVTALTELVQWLNKVIGGLADLVTILEGTVLLGFAKCIEMVDKFGVEAGLVVDKLKIAWQALGRTIQDVTSGSLSEVASEWTIAQAQMDVATKKAGASLAGYTKQYEDLRAQIAQATGALTNFWSALGEKNGEAGGGGALNTGKEKDTRDQFAREATNTQVELSKLAFQQIEQDQTALVNQFKESEADKVQALIAATELMVQTEQDALDKEASLYEEDSIAYQQVQDKKKILAAQAALEISKLNEQLVAAQKRQYEAELAPWKQLMSDMGGAFDTMINGILQGTARWKQQVARGFDDLFIKFAEVISKMIAEWAVFEATSGAGILGFGTTNPFSALSGVGGSATQAVSLTANTTAVTADTTAVTANTAALVANTGAQGGSAIGGIGAAAGFLGFFDNGSWNLPSNGLAFLHAGEMVIPAQQAGQIRSGAASIGGSSGGGSPINISLNLSAIDSQTGTQFLLNNMPAIASGIATQIRNNNSSLSAAMRG
jgi:hypothetical protein